MYGYKVYQHRAKPLRARRRERRRCGGAVVGCVLLLSILFWILHCCADCQASIAKFLITRLLDSEA